MALSARLFLSSEVHLLAVTVFPALFRTIKDKRDAYVRRLNDIYENNVKKVSMGSVYPAIQGAKVMDFWPVFQLLWASSSCGSPGSISCLPHLILLLIPYLLPLRLTLTSSGAMASSLLILSQPSKWRGKSTRLLTSL